jgi:hypothetical protein
MTGVDPLGPRRRRRCLSGFAGAAAGGGPAVRCPAVLLLLVRGMGGRP